MSKDGNYAASIAYAMGSSYVADYVTPTSKTLHKGTAVQFKVTETLGGSFDAPCSEIGPGFTDSVSAYGYGASVVGICSNGAFVFTTGSGAQGQTDTETVTLYIGTPVAIAQGLEYSDQLDDCSGGALACPPGQPGYLGPLSETFSDVKAVFQIDPITPGVSYTTASGHSYR